MSCCEHKKKCCEVKNSDTQTISIALVGNPNCGKTTLFNVLTGARQRVGNWPGVTVERKSGQFTHKCHTVEVVDLPGLYSLTLSSDTGAIDERIACEYIVEQRDHIIINIVDASNLERHLYLTTQLIEMGVPLILALNMMDVARARGINIDINGLSKELGCPVIALEAHKGNGIADLKRSVIEFKPTQAKKINHLEPVQKAAEQIIKLLDPADKPRDDGFVLRVHDGFSHRLDDSFALRLLEDDAYVHNLVSPEILGQVRLHQKQIQQTAREDADILIAESRYQFIQNILQQVITRSAHIKKSWTARIDNIVLNRILGIPIFLAVMYFLFLFSINIGGAFQDFFDISSQTIFVDGLGYALTQLGAPTWLTVLLANGIGKGINTTITFIPVIGAMFLFLAFLEDSGYMARAAFVIDRFMRALKLPGKAFVPMIVGFGCNVPAVMGARTLENKADRILTIMMSPFMSCGARLAIYAVFIAAFFPQGGQNIVFALYLIGIFMAVFTGFLLRKTLLKGDASPLIMELPSYHMPHFKTLLLHAWQRLKNFVFRAGKLIIPICVLIGALNSLNIDGTMNTGDGDVQSLLSSLGKLVTPLFAPMGIQTDNWPATVGLLTGVLAKEVVIGTLNTLYTQMGQLASGGVLETFSLWGGLKEALLSIPQNFAVLGDALSNPVLAKAPIDPVDQSVYGLMFQKFDGKIGAFAYLLFVLLYFPCISTTAAMLRELHRMWAIFSAVWMTGVAYGAAVIFYQAATFLRHPLSSSLWIIAISAFFLGTIAAIKWYGEKQNKVQGLLGEPA